MKKSNSRVFFLLGAGSSMPYFPSTLELTKALTSTKLIDISSFVELKDKTYFGYLADISSQIWGRALNFEELIHLSILFSNLSKSQFDTIKQIPKPFMKLATKIKDEFLKFDDELESKWASQLACDFILDEIRNYSDKNKNKLSSSSLNSALNILDQQGYILDIFSLNYDNLVDYSKVNFETGFDKDRTTTNYKVFKPEKFYSHELSHVYCQMHGSILFNTRGIPNRQSFEVIRFDSHQEAKDYSKISPKDRIYPNLFIKLQDGSEVPSIPMITGLHKTEMMLIDPYSTYYQKIFDHLINSSIWILAGYGGLDPHINSCIARARKIKSERNDKFQIIISDYCKDIEQKLRDSTYLTSKVSHLFWPEWERVLKLGTAKSSEDLIFKLNHDIYGAWLNDKEILMFDFEGIETFSHKLPSLIEKLTLNN